MSRATTKSLRAKGRLNILACSTPDSYIRWMGSKDIGMHTRFITVPLKEKSVLYNAPQAIGLTPEEQTQLDEMLQTLRKTKGRIDIADVEESINCWQESKKRLGLIIAPNMISRFIHRIGIMAMRGAALMAAVTDDREQVKNYALFLAEYIFQADIYQWGYLFEETTPRNDYTTTRTNDPNYRWIYSYSDVLPNEFTVSEAKNIIFGTAKKRGDVVRTDEAIKKQIQRYCTRNNERQTYTLNRQ